jgi:hypothetical protein
MIIPTFPSCPVCSAQDISHHWRKYKYTDLWREKACSNRSFGDGGFGDEGCGFSQNFLKSYEEETTTYYQFSTKDFSFYVYSGNPTFGSAAGRTHIYHRRFPREEVVMNYIFNWENFQPNFQELDKLNQKLKVLVTFL